MENLLKNTGETCWTCRWYNEIGNCCALDDERKYPDSYACEDHEERNDGKATA